MDDATLSPQPESLAGESTPEETPPPVAPEAATPEGPPPSKTYTASDVAAARISAEKKAKDLAKQVESLTEFKTQVETDRQEAEDAEKSEVQKALDRATAAETATVTAEAGRILAEHNALVAQVAAQVAPGLDPLFLKFVEGEDADSVRDNVSALVELMKKQPMMPRSIGGPGNPPQPAELPGGGDNGAGDAPRKGAEYFADLQKWTDAAADPSHPQHHEAAGEIAKLTGFRST